MGFVLAIRDAFARGDLTLPPPVPDPAALEQLLRLSRRTDWVSYLKKPFGGPDQVLAYLSSYTHRIAISNRRIVAFDGQNVTFTWRDYKDHYAAKTTSLDATEFLRRFAIHVVPQRFVRIRYFGFLANRLRHKSIAHAAFVTTGGAAIAMPAQSGRTAVGDGAEGAELVR